MPRKRTWRLLFGAALAVTTATSVQVLADKDKDSDTASEAMSPEATRGADSEMAAIAEDAYVYGYPLMLMDQTMKQSTNVETAGITQAPVNQLAGEILAALVPGPPAAAAKAPEQPAASTPAPDAASILAGRYRGTLRTCPEPERLAIDVKAPGEIGVTLGAAEPRSLFDVSVQPGRLLGTFESSSGSSESQYRLELRAAGNRLEGAVTRRTSLGPLANLLVTLWAELDRER